MSKHIDPSAMYNLPSGSIVHPCRLIHKDGTLMWKHALLYNNEVSLPKTEAQEVHIQKTAQRLEELNSWIMPYFEPWEALKVLRWYDPADPELTEGISLYFVHHHLDTELIYDMLKNHIYDHETLQLRDSNIFFSRC